MHRYFIFLLFSFFLATGFVGASEVLRYWIVSDASTLEIQGSSNVNTFACGSSVFNGHNVLVEMQDKGTNSISGEILLDVKGFDCQNRIMNNDFQNTLQASDFPEIRIEFLELKETGRKGNNKKVEGWVEITLAGEKRKYPVACKLETLNHHQNILTGSQIFRFSDFGLEPPQKALGMVRVKNEIAVEFRLELDLADSPQSITGRK
jgi:hypothetical protein